MVKTVHPSKFFHEVDCKIGFDVIEYFDTELKEQLKTIHPMNFIKSKVELPVYKVIVEYDTLSGNHHKSEKYMVLDSCHTESPDEYSDFWADMACYDYNLEHPNNPMLNMKIMDVLHICDAVLPIG